MNLPIINEIKLKISYQLLMHTYMGAQRSKRQQKHVKRAIIYCTYYSLTLSSVTSLSFNLWERKGDHWSKLSFGRLFTISIAVGIASHESQNQRTVSVLCYQQFHYFEAWADPSLLCRIKSWKNKKLRLRTSDELRPIKCRVISFVSAASNRISEHRQFILPRRDVFNFSSSPYK